MRKGLAWLICALLMLSTALAEGAPGEKLGFELLREVYAPGQNRVLSPLSLTLALGMAAEGARGATLEALLGALEAEDAAALSAPAPAGVVSANAAFVSPRMKLLPAYAEAIGARCGAELFAIDAQIVERVNDWVFENTDGLIDSLLSDAPSDDTRLILINAVAMQAKWVYAFDPDFSAPGRFAAASGAVEAQMMRLRETLRYGELNGAQLVCLPYADGDLEMWVILPEAGGMPALTDALAAGGLAPLRAAASPREVILTLPKLDLSDAQSLKAPLSALGLKEIFAPTADFSDIGDAALRIDDVLQKARIQVDEDGTKAAAATAVMAVAACAPMEDAPEPVEMIVDRPFVFVIADAGGGAPCFVGAVENPLG